ncbi:unnamed protein product [Cunninghamella blakesleeana]
MSNSTNYHLPAIAAMAGIALAASGYVLSTSTSETRKRKRRVKSKIMRERDDKYVIGLVNTGNSCFANSILQALATLACLRSYLAERVDEQGDEAGAQQIPPNEFILQSVAFALYSTIELLNRPIGRPKAIVPNDIIHALERKIQGTISRDQQDAHELFQIISSVLTSEEEEQYKSQNQAPSLLDVGTIKLLTSDSDPYSPASDNFETSSMSSIGTLGSMWSSFSVSTTGGNLHRRPRRPRNPFTGLAASKISCMKCGYTAPIRHHTFDNISLTVPQTLNCTLESCLSTYTKTDILTDYQCRKCTLLNTLEKLTKQLKSVNEDECLILQDQIRRLNEALKNNIEMELNDITLTPPQTTSCTSKQTMFANPPKSLCLHLSRSVYHPSGYIQKNHCNVQFPEYLDLAPYSTNGFLNTQDPSASLSSLPTTSQPQMRTSRTSLVYLRNMAGKRYNSSSNSNNSSSNSQEDGLNILLPDHHQQQQGQLHSMASSNGNGNNNKIEDRNVPSILPSLTIPAIRPIQYRLTAVIVHYGNHDSGHFITYRRKKLPTGQDVRSPLSNDYFYGNNGIYHHHHHHHHHLNPYQPHQTKSTTFWRCNDDSVEEVDLDTVLQSEAYMLFYERDI